MNDQIFAFLQDHIQGIASVIIPAIGAIGSIYCRRKGKLASKEITEIRKPDGAVLKRKLEIFK